MSTALHVKTTILPGGRLEVIDPQFLEGQPVEVFIVFSDVPMPEPRRSAVEILRSAPGHRLFQTAEEVEAHLHAERSAWD